MMLILSLNSLNYKRENRLRHQYHFGGLVHACYEKVEEGAVRNLQKEKDDGRD